MNHERLIMPHPVLRLGGSDYGDGDSFSMTVTRSRRVDKDVVVEVSFNLSCSALAELIKSGAAKFFVMAKCSRTYYRISAISDEPEITFTVRSSDLWDVVRITPYVIASKDVPWFETGDATDLLNATGDPIPCGSILAVSETHEIQLGKIGTFQSAIRIVPNPAIEDGIYLVNSHGDFVVVEVGPRTFSDVSSMRPRATDLLYPSIYQAALEFAIREMGEHTDSMWARALQKTLANYKIDIDDDLAKQAHKHAQTLLGKPLDKMIAWHAREGVDPE